MTIREASTKTASDAIHCQGHFPLVKISDLIRTELNRLGMSKRELARRLGLSHGAINQWEDGSSKPTFSNFIDMCGVFGVSVAGFVGAGGPYQGQIVEDADEMRVLELWRRLSAEDKAHALRVLTGLNAGSAGSTIHRA